MNFKQLAEREKPINFQNAYLRFQIWAKIRQKYSVLQLLIAETLFLD